ncbi:MAG TPA: hypothetical protein VGA78_17490 [Gemmatimonadales bacterium]|jgi:hypothetical protein
MRVFIAALSVIVTLVSVGSLEAQQLRPDSYRWYFGVQGGALLAQTQTQDYKTFPSAGAHLMVVGKRGGVMLSFEESFGDQEGSAFAFIYQQETEDIVDGQTVTDTVDVFAIHQAGFDRVRKYSASLMAFPIRAQLEPYLGVGFGLMHTVGTRVESTIPTPLEGFLADSVVRVRSSTGFGSFVGGLQYGAGGRVVVYGQYQITTSPAGGNLLTGPSHTFLFGLRFGLGRAKEDIKGGGY